METRTNGHNPLPYHLLLPFLHHNPADYWAAPAITAAYEDRFMDGYPNNTFQPAQKIPKVSGNKCFSEWSEVDY